MRNHCVCVNWVLGLVLVLSFIFLSCTNHQMVSLEKDAFYPEQELDYRELVRPLPDTPIPTDIGSFVLIKGGTFTMGAPPESARLWSKSAHAKNIHDWALPQHMETVGDFLLGKYPVTSTEYSEFLNEQSRANRDTRTFLKLGGEASKVVHAKDGLYEPRPGFEWAPIAPVSYEGAQAYCEWLSARDDRKYRLPTEVEWEYAARGSAGRLYPWGNESPVGRTYLWEVHGYDLPNDYVGRFPEGATPDGVYDMINGCGEICQNALHRYTTESITGNKERWKQYIQGKWLYFPDHEVFVQTPCPAKRGGMYAVREPRIVVNGWSRMSAPPMKGGPWDNGGCFRLLCEVVPDAPESKKEEAAESGKESGNPGPAQPRGN